MFADITYGIDRNDVTSFMRFYVTLIFADALYKWFNKNAAGNGLGGSGGFNLGNDPQFYSDYNSGFAYSQEPTFIEQTDSGSSYYPADTNGWNKRK